MLTRLASHALMGLLVSGAVLGIGLGLSEAPGLPSQSSPSVVVTPVLFPPTLPGGQKLPAGAVVTSVVHLRGEQVAAGIDTPAGGPAVLPSCAANGCNPMVWSKSIGNTWRATWGNSTDIPGSIPASTLVVGAGRLLLFSGDEATRLWSSTDAVTWHQVAVPETMAALDIEDAVFGHDRFVAILNNKYAGGSTLRTGRATPSGRPRTGSPGHVLPLEGRRPDSRR